MGTMAQQLELALHKLSPNTGNSSQGRDKQVSGMEGYESRHRSSQEERIPSYKIHKPKHFFPTFNGEDVHRWLYKCAQYFEIEEIANTDKLRITSYYLEGVALYWHQNFLRSAENQRATWEEYVEAIRCRFGGQQDPLEELMKLKQRGNLEEYIQDFDILWNKAEINEKQLLVIFLGGLELEIKNTVKMFEPKTLKHAYNLARLQANTLSYKKFSSSPKRHSPPIMTTQPHLPTTPNSTQSPTTMHKTLIKPNPARWHNNPSTSTCRNSIKPTKSLKNQEFEERRLKGLCFWCDDKFVPDHRCRSKRLYSLSITEKEDEVTTEEPTGDDLQARELSRHIFLDALEGTVGLNTMKVTGRLDRTTVSILIDSGSTHNFLNAELALKLQLQLTAIKPMMVQAANGERMVCKSLCKGLRWMMQGISFVADVFIIDLSNCEMVLGIQWLSLLGDILCNYKHLWMSFDWQGKRVLLKGENPPKLQYIELEHLNSLARSHG